MVEEANFTFSELLKSAVEAKLKNAELYDIASYGWLNENDPDPEYIGHAMWQIDAPAIDDQALFEDRPVQRRPKEIEKEILVVGEDFWGLMQASRLSIGLALIWKSKAQQNPINDSNFFWLHHTDAFLKLAMASERLRDLLVIGCTGGPLKSYRPEQRKRRFTAPFVEASDLIAVRGIDKRHLVEPLRQLTSSGRVLFKYIDRRNQIVHEVATRMAQFVDETVSRLQRRYDHEQKNRFQAKIARKTDMMSRAKRRRKQIIGEIDCAADELREWYLLLIQTSNLVFQVEYWTRRSGIK